MVGFFFVLFFFTFAGVSFVYELLHSEHEVELTQSFFSESVCTVVSFFFTLSGKNRFYFIICLHGVILSKPDHLTTNYK